MSIDTYSNRGLLEECEVMRKDFKQKEGKTLKIKSRFNNMISDK